jgi:hypothetical protein
MCGVVCPSRDRGAWGRAGGMRAHGGDVPRGHGQLLGQAVLGDHVGHGLRQAVLAVAAGYAGLGGHVGHFKLLRAAIAA